MAFAVPIFSDSFVLHYVLVCMALATLAFLPQYHSLMQLTRCCSSVLYYIGTMEDFKRILFETLGIFNTYSPEITAYLLLFSSHMCTFCFLMPCPTYYKSKTILDPSKLFQTGSTCVRQFKIRYKSYFLNHIQIKELFWNYPKQFGRVQNCFGFIEGQGISQIPQMI